MNPKRKNVRSGVKSAKSAKNCGARVRANFKKCENEFSHLQKPDYNKTLM